MPPPEKCKIFVRIFSFMSCFKQQVLFFFFTLARSKGGGEVGKQLLFLFCFLCGLQKKYLQTRKRGFLLDA